MSGSQFSNICTIYTIYYVYVINFWNDGIVFYDSRYDMLKMSGVTCRSIADPHIQQLEKGSRLN